MNYCALTFLFIITGYENKTNMCARSLMEEDAKAVAAATKTCENKGRYNPYAVASRCISEERGIIDAEGVVNKIGLGGLIRNSESTFLTEKEENYFLTKVDSLSTWKDDLGKYCDTP